MREEGVCAQTLRRTDRQAGRQTDTEHPGCGQCAEDKKFNTISCTKRNWKHPIYTVSIYNIFGPFLAPLPPPRFRKIGLCLGARGYCSQRIHV